MSSVVSRVWTQNIANTTLDIIEDYGLTSITVLLLSGTGTITGDLSIGGLNSEPLSLQVGISFGISSVAGYSIDGITITSSGGIIQIAGSR